MKNKILLLIMIAFINMKAYGLERISVSVSPIASIVGMVVGDSAEISVINASGGCPHHYQMKLSDKEKLDDAKILIYIDDGFDCYAGRLASNFKGKIVKISQLSSIDFLDSEGQVNWHFWLDLDNVLVLLNELANVIKIEIPSLSNVIDSNLNRSVEKIKSLKRFKAHILAHLEDAAILSDSLGHFTKDMSGSIIQLYQRDNSSLKSFDNLENSLNSENIRCIVIDNLQNPGVYEKYNKKIIQLDSENWLIENTTLDIQNLFCDQYIKMIESLKGC
jgi:zinc transport system substrate-binding protein